MTIHVTKTYLPEPEEYSAYLKQIWADSYVTNNGPMVRKLEKDIEAYLGVGNLIFVNNGTLALQMALKSLGKTGEVITTPFSYVATTAAIVWEGSKPVFADIDPDTLCLDPEKVEAAITDKTIGIIPTHVFGNSSGLEALEAISKKYNIPVMYDAAHSFGVKYKGESVCNYGALSCLSFHATKLFHTVEGGAIVTNNDELAEDFRRMRAFCHKPGGEYWGLGINAKNTEIHAAMGLCVLPKVDEFIERRAVICNKYKELLTGLPVTYPTISDDITYNYAYFPALFSSQEVVLSVEKALNDQDIFPRRYFYPSLNNLPYVEYSPCPVSEDATLRVLCLPLHPYLDLKDVERICDTIKAAMQQFA